MVTRALLSSPLPLPPGEELSPRSELRVRGARQAAPVAPSAGERHPPLARRARTRTPRRRTPRGFALFDVIIAGIIIGISIAAIIGLTGRALSAQAQGEELQTAALLADEQLNLVLARGPDNYGRSFPASGECDPPFSKFSYSLQFSGGNGSDPYRVTVTITWVGGGGGAERSVSLQTLIAPREGDEPDPDRKPTETPSRLQ